MHPLRGFIIETLRCVHGKRYALKKNNMKTKEHELEILENIYNHKEQIHQRDLARIVGLSLGMTNAILKRLVKKGWLKIKKVNNRNIQYIVSPRGIDEITRRSYRYFKRTIKNVVYYKEAISGLIKGVKDRGYKGIVLIGKSDLDFIVEHYCIKHNLEWITDETRENDHGIFYLYSERYIPDESIEDAGFLQRIIRPRE